MLLMRDAATSRHVIAELDKESSANISGGRCSIVRDFLNHPAEPEWLWMVDDDMTFGDDILERLLATADVDSRPIVGGLCFGVRPLKINGVDYFNPELGTHYKPFPTIYTLADNGKMVHWQTYPENMIIPVHSTGAACLLIHRRVLADERWTADGHPLPWFRETVLAGEVCSEDHFFCIRAGSLGYPIHIDTAAKTGHVKTFVVDEEMYLHTRVVPPADERVTVIVPVLGRPENAEPFMRSLRASTGMAHVFTVCSEDEDERAWEAAGGFGINSNGRVTFPEKANLAVAVLDQIPEYALDEWIFLCGDDVVFRPGWLDQAQHTARLTGAQVVGVNDMGNPRIMAGEMSTHFLIRRSYIEERGASWSGPGVVCHEGYRHCFVDNEIVTVAKQRGVFAMSRASIVEHMHPEYGKAPMDATYELGYEKFEQDEREFRSRVARFGKKGRAA
jgi:GT2 family glycosyltransferase